MKTKTVPLSHFEAGLYPGWTCYGYSEYFDGVPKYAEIKKDEAECHKGNQDFMSQVLNEGDGVYRP